MTVAEIIVPADPDQDDCLEAAAETYIRNYPALEGWGLAPRFASETDRESVVLTVPYWAAPGYEADPEAEADVHRARERDE